MYPDNNRAMHAHLHLRAHMRNHMQLISLARPESHTHDGEMREF